MDTANSASTDRVNPFCDKPIPEYALQWDSAVCRPATLPAAYDEDISPEHIFYIPSGKEDHSQSVPETTRRGYVVAERCESCKKLRKRCTRARPSCRRCETSGKVCKFSVSPSILPGPSVLRSRKEKQNGSSSSYLPLQEDTRSTTTRPDQTVDGASSSNPPAPGLRLSRPRKCKQPRSAPENISSDAVVPESSSDEVQDGAAKPKRRRKHDNICTFEVPSGSNANRSTAIKRGPKPKGITGTKDKGKPQSITGRRGGLQTSRTMHKPKITENVPYQPTWHVVPPPNQPTLGGSAAASLGSASTLPRIWANSKEELCEVIPELARSMNGVVWQYTETPTLFLEGQAWPNDLWDGKSVIELSLVRTFSNPVPPGTAADISPPFPLPGRDHSLPTLISPDLSVLPGASAISAPVFSTGAFGTVPHPSYLHPSLRESASDSSMSLPVLTMDGLYTLSASPSPPPEYMPLLPEQRSTDVPWRNGPATFHSISANVVPGPSSDLLVQQDPCQYRDYLIYGGVALESVPPLLPAAVHGSTKFHEGMVGRGVHLGVFASTSADYGDWGKVADMQSISPVADACQFGAVQTEESSTMSAVPIPGSSRGSALQGYYDSSYSYYLPQILQHTQELQRLIATGSAADGALMRSIPGPHVHSQIPETFTHSSTFHGAGPTEIYTPPKLHSSPMDEALNGNPPPEIKALLDCYTKRIPVSIIATRNSSLVRLGLPEEYGCVFLGLFKITEVEIFDRDVNSLQPVQDTRHARHWRFRFVWTPGGDSLDPSVGPLPRWWVPAPTGEGDGEEDQDIDMLMQPYNLLPLELMASSTFSQEDFENGTSELTTSHGWHCGECGMLNVQRNLRHQKCGHCRRGNFMPPVDVGCLRNPYTTAPQILPWDRPSDGVSSFTVKRPDSMRVFRYKLGDSQIATHLFTGNLEKHQDQPTRLFREFQMKIEMPMRGLKAGLGAGPYYTYFVGKEGGVPAVPWADVPECVSAAKELMLHLGRTDGGESSLKIDQLIVLAWTSTGSRKGIFPAKKSCITLLCLGADIELSISVRSEVSPTRMKGGAQAANRAATSSTSSPAASLVLSRRTAKKRKYPSSVQRKTSSAPSKNTWKEALLVTLVHGDILVLTGDDFQYSMKRAGMNIVLIGTS
ncbi:hypothetical protein BKA93DRAFT_783028 [Sparassis latifolia]